MQPSGPVQAGNGIALSFFLNVRGTNDEHSPRLLVRGLISELINCHYRTCRLVIVCCVTANNV